MNDGVIPTTSKYIKHPNEKTAKFTFKKTLHPQKRPGPGHIRDMCDACDEEGSLIYCDRCPAKFHFGCRDNPPVCDDELPIGQWLCHKCRMKLTDVTNKLKSDIRSDPLCVYQVNDTDAADVLLTDPKNMRKLRKRSSSQISVSSDNAVDKSIGTSISVKGNVDRNSRPALDEMIRATSLSNSIQLEFSGEMNIHVAFPATDKGSPKSPAFSDHSNCSTPISYKGYSIPSPSRDSNSSPFSEALSQRIQVSSDIKWASNTPIASSSSRCHTPESRLSRNRMRRIAMTKKERPKKLEYRDRTQTPNTGIYKLNEFINRVKNPVQVKLNESDDEILSQYAKCVEDQLTTQTTVPDSLQTFSFNDSIDDAMISLEIGQICANIQSYTDTTNSVSGSKHCSTLKRHHTSGEFDLKPIEAKKTNKIEFKRSLSMPSSDQPAIPKKCSKMEIKKKHEEAKERLRRKMQVLQNRMNCSSKPK